MSRHSPAQKPVIAAVAGLEQSPIATTASYTRSGAPAPGSGSLFTMVS
jgi:hypothetical protein